MSSQSGAQIPYKSFTGYYLTTANAKTALAGQLETANGFANDASIMIDNLAKKNPNTNYTVDLTVNNILFVRAANLPEQPYILGISYLDSTAPGAQMYANWSVVNLPWDLSTNVMTPAPLYLNGNPLNPYKYVVNSQIYGTAQLELDPVAGNVAADVPKQIIVYINANMQTSQTTQEMFYIMSYSIDLSESFFLPTQNIAISIPEWLQWPYWVQDLFALSNIFGTFQFGSPAVETVIPRGTYNGTNVAGIYTTFAAAQYLTQSNEALLPSQGLPAGLPSAMVQVILSIVDTNQVGNQSSGKIVCLLLFKMEGPNQQGFEWTPNFWKQTKNQCTGVGSQATWIYDAQDRLGDSFRSLTATFDMTTSLSIYVK
jgi:hypothetical protein